MNGKNGYGNDFWDLGKIIAEKKSMIPEENKTSPAPKQEQPSRRPERRITLTKITDGYKEAETSEKRYYSAEKLAFDKSKNSDFIERESVSGLILNVKLMRAWGSPRSFTRTAEKYWNTEGEEVQFSDFYAYSPTYANFNIQTFKYYLWWRTNFRRSNPIKCSWPYISVYISELINCPALVSENECNEKLWQLFEAYADVDSPYFLNDALCKLPEIICDYSLIHSLRVPAFVSERTLLLAVKSARLREVFFEDENEELFCKLLISVCSEYEFAKSKFAADIVNSDNEKYIKLAILECKNKAKSEGIDHPLAGKIKEVTTVSRHSYSNYVYVDPEYLYVITVDYCSVNRSYTLRNSISGIVKQCENNLRMLNGIKPRLKVFSLEPVFRETVDEFFEKTFPPAKRKKTVRRTKNEEIPDYEKYYENERSHDFSLANAKKIEEKSWDVVEKLVEAIENETVAEMGCKSADASNDIDFFAGGNSRAEQKEDTDVCSSSELDAILSACPECREFLLAVCDGDIPKVKKIAREMGIPVQVLADTVNAAAFDVIGDILIENDGDFIQIINDYEYIFCKDD